LPSKEVEALAVVFDLSGFTNFCSKVDPHLSVPEYLSNFLYWMFDEIRTEFTTKVYRKSKALWSELPFLAKFLGDGVLFLWDTSNMTETRICNIVVSLLCICREYRNTFHREIKTVVGSPPKVLRCGIARGRVFSVGNGQDYVGSCINIASRLQKWSDLAFCFSQRGFDIEQDMEEVNRRNFVEKLVTLRGIGEELVWVLKKEFNNLPEKERELFRSP
jgi:class 3 adenylate cyclase